MLLIHSQVVACPQCSNQLRVRAAEARQWTRRPGEYAPLCGEAPPTPLGTAP